ncbi:MAG: hypothetical protein RLZZ511_1793 [Cyanobacteriota bacterium]|jgi:tetratricopeptide (TPR) repeat protein
MVFRIVSQDGIERGLRVVAASLLAIGALTGLVLMQQQRLVHQRATALLPQQQDQQETIYMKSLRRLPTQGFGFNNLIADGVFLRFLQYIGDTEVRSVAGYGAAPDYFELITQRDPRFVETYVFGVGTLSYDLGMPEESIRLLDRGIAAIDPKKSPDAASLWALKALDQLLLIGDSAGAAQSYAMAAEWSKQSPDPGWWEEAKNFQRTSAFLQSDPNSGVVRFWAWSSVFAQAQLTKNLKTQERARQELLAMGAIEGKSPEGEVVFMPPPAPKPTPSQSAKPSESPTAAPSPTAVPSPTAAPSPTVSPSPTN